MIIVQKPEQLKGKELALTMGFFDGVHKGHMTLINRILHESKRRALHSAVLTFWPHPRLVLNKDPQKLRFLTTLNEKSRMLSKLGIDFLIIQEFQPSFASMDAEAFVKYLVETYNVRHLVVGQEHRFGKYAEGSSDTLKQLADKYHYTVDTVAVIETHDVNISSTKIRDALLNGYLDKANDMLGYPYMLTGIIESGNQLGRRLGFPTANIRPNDPLKLIPCHGVYAVVLNVNGILKKGMLNVGFRPTVDSTKHQTIEVHIFDFNSDIYHQKVEVAFIARLRNEKRFPDLDQLRAQLLKDRDDAEEVLKEFPPDAFRNYFLTLPAAKQ